MIPIDDFKKVEVAVGEIKNAENIPASEKLLRLTVDFGEERPRQVVSGIKKYFPNPSDLVSIKCAFVVNLEPRPLMGLMSEAMILAVSTDDAFSLLKVGQDIPVGTRVK